MKRLLFAGLGLVLLAATACESSPAESPKADPSKTDAPKSDGPNPVVVMETSKGTIKIELFADKAPITVKNFLELRGREVLRRHDLPPRDAGLHDPGRRLQAGHEGQVGKDSGMERDARSHQERSGQRAVQRARHDRHGPHRRPRQRHGPVLSSTSWTTPDLDKAAARPAATASSAR